MASIVLRLRLVTGDRIDVKYEEAETPGEAAVLENAIKELSDPSGTIRARHGDRMIVIYGRGVATIEVEPRGAVL
jgi:hypothetical protein